MSSDPRKPPPGSAPGTLVIDESAPKPVIRAICYNGHEFEETLLVRPNEAIPMITDRRDRVTWVHVHGLGNEAVLRELGIIFNVHPLALEDVVHAGHRPASAEYDAHRMVIARSLERAAGGEIHSEQVSMFLGEGVLLTFHEKSNDHFDAIRERLRRGRGLMRRMGADYLLYSLLDSVIDHLFPLMQALGDELEEIEADVLRSPERTTLARVHRIKADLLAVRRTVWPLRDVVSSLLRDDTGLVQPDTKIHLRDCYDHAVQLIEMVETDRELASSLLDVYMSSLGLRTNEVMKTLTVVTTVFVPLTFVAGVYGMNFDTGAGAFNMPELKWRYGYPVVMGAMALLALAILMAIRRAGWLSDDGPASAAPPPRQAANGAALGLHLDALPERDAARDLARR
jgi:magnesium transporter